MVDLGYADAKRRGRQKAVGFAAVYQTSPATFKRLLEGSTFRLKVLFPRGKARVDNAIVLLSTENGWKKFYDDEMEDKRADYEMEMALTSLSQNSFGSEKCGVKQREKKRRK